MTNFTIKLGDRSPRQFISVLPGAQDNCQTNILGYPYDIVDPNINSPYTKEDRKNWLKTILQISQRKQLLLDINEKWLNKLRNALKPYYTKFIIKRYVSTNGSKMIICIVQLDIDKIMQN